MRAVSPFQALDWLQQSGDHYLSTHTSPGATAAETQELLNQHREFCVSAKVRRRRNRHAVAFLTAPLGRRSAPQHTQEKVHLLIQLAESMLAKGHAHRTELRRCVSAVDKRYREFTVRMGQYRHLLETELGGCSQVGGARRLCKESVDFHWSFKGGVRCSVRTTRTWSWS